MNRRSVKVLITIQFLIIGTLVFAAPFSIYTSLDRTNSLISSTIERTVATANTLVSANVSPDRIITNLIMITDCYAATMINRASFYGVTVVSQYDPVLIGGRIAWVDPCRVLND